MPELTAIQIPDAPSGRLIDVLEWKQSTQIGADLVTQVWPDEDTLAPIKLTVETYWTPLTNGDETERAATWLHPDEAVALAQRLLDAVSAVTPCTGPVGS